MSEENGQSPTKPPTSAEPLLYDRREFIRVVAIGGSAFMLFGAKGGCTAPEEEKALQLIIADYEKCIGCRTCETVCSAHNESVMVGGERLNGLGNPYFSRIRVTRFSPDVDIPMVCVNCYDPPCIAACTSLTDPVTGGKALYRDPDLLVIKHNPLQCGDCESESCYEACKTHSVGVILPNPETRQPMRICNLCDGDPQCVKYCPAGTLTVTTINAHEGSRFFNMPPEAIAAQLAKEWYYFEGE